MYGVDRHIKTDEEGKKEEENEKRRKVEEQHTLHAFR